ncbi:dienelactone hydrolase family protein [Microbulbifer flavimaris]|uniref:Dienelactone hydrolase family protein n=1 Tax=Microbulbifer flavimaris TaxID=1781068 RepID=A0ABX4I1H3_9GAMM|nr:MULTISPECIES: dienelactone hydrolase family protein [Microbulbifer]KUJ84193.1 dienelactone hydrolase [Microbulbifer sp. ZGT114]PCO06267.1 dienelactone hydrolase family protein [Microbulbifer flavimaris]
MCDELTSKEAEAYFLKRGLSRRDFGRLGVGAVLASMLPVTANALAVKESNVTVQTPDGEANAYFVHPGKGRHPAVILWPDIFGLRPAFRQMGKRLAESGYAVLVVNPYYRTMKGQLVPDDAQVIGPELRKAIWPKAREQASTLSPETAVTDGRAFIQFLDQQPSVDTSKPAGTLGYCMTGSYAFRLAADMPERIGAGASFHGGRLVTDKENSPHRLVPQIQAGFLVAIAENDDERDPEAKVELRKAFDEAGVPAEIEVYKGTLHGWCPPDSMAHNPKQAERAWRELLVLFERNLI